MKPHRFDTISFIAGVFIAGIGLTFLLPGEPSQLFDIFGGVGAISTWFWPVLFFAIGLVVLLPLVSRARPQDETEADDADQTL